MHTACASILGPLMNSGLHGYLDAPKLSTRFSLSAFTHSAVPMCYLHQAFRETAMKSDFIRQYIRLYKTPAAKVKLDNS